MLLRDARLAERVETRQSLGSRVNVQTDLADEELIVNLLHQFLASRHDDGTGRRQRAGRRQSSVEHGTLYAVQYNMQQT